MSTLSLMIVLVTTAVVVFNTSTVTTTTNVSNLVQENNGMPSLENVSRPSNINNSINYTESKENSVPSSSIKKIMEDQNENLLLNNKHIFKNSSAKISPAIPQTIKIQSNNNNFVNNKLNSSRLDKFQSNFNEYGNRDNTTLLNTKSPSHQFNENLNRAEQHQFTRLNSTITSTQVSVVLVEGEQEEQNVSRKYIQYNETVVATEFLNNSNRIPKPTNGKTYLNNVATEDGHKFGSNGLFEKIKLAKGGINAKQELKRNDTLKDFIEDEHGFGMVTREPIHVPLVSTTQSSKYVSLIVNEILIILQWFLQPKIKKC